MNPRMLCGNSGLRCKGKCGPGGASVVLLTSSRIKYQHTYRQRELSTYQQSDPDKQQTHPRPGRPPHRVPDPLPFSNALYGRQSPWPPQSSAAPVRFWSSASAPPSRLCALALGVIHPKASSAKIRALVIQSARREPPRHSQRRWSWRAQSPTYCVRRRGYRGRRSPCAVRAASSRVRPHVGSAYNLSRTPHIPARS